MGKLNNDGTISGRIGGTVQRSVNGTTYISARPSSVKNPQTDMQMAQRTKKQNIVNMYGYMKPALKDNFQGKVGKQSDYSKFVGCNLSQQPVYLDQSDAAVKACVVAPYIVSFGTLASLEYHLEDGWLVSDIYVGKMEITPETPLNNLIWSILAPLSGWNEGDIMEFIICQQTSNYSGKPIVEVKHANLEIVNNDKTRIGKYLDGIELKANEEGFLCMKAEGEGGFAIVRKRNSSKGILTGVQKMVVNNSLLEDYGSREKLKQSVESYLTTKNKKEREQMKKSIFATKPFLD